MNQLRADAPMQTYAWPRVPGPVDHYLVREYIHPSGDPGITAATPDACPVLEIDPASFSSEYWRLTVEAVDAQGMTGPASELSDVYTVPEVGVLPGLLILCAGLWILRRFL